MHWTVTVIHMTEKRIQYYDSMSRSGDRYLKGLMRYLKDEHLAKIGCPLIFSQEHVNRCRERIALSIMKGVAIE
jgi:sentrin-specific protease 1